MDHEGLKTLLDWISAHGWRLFWALFLIAGSRSASVSVRR